MCLRKLRLGQDHPKGLEETAQGSHTQKQNSPVSNSQSGESSKKQHALGLGKN